jgi:hypothetical protein
VDVAAVHRVGKQKIHGGRVGQSGEKAALHHAVFLGHVAACRHAHFDAFGVARDETRLEPPVAGRLQEELGCAFVDGHDQRT